MITSTMYLFKQLFRFWKTLLVLLVILMLCLIPASDLRKIDLLKFDYQDLVVHLIMFIAFSTLFFHDLQRSLLLSATPMAISVTVFVTGILLGITTEMLQYVLVSLNRSASLTDLLFDLIGTILGIVYMRFIRR
jgi:hypothetical protein